MKKNLTQCLTTSIIITLSYFLLNACQKGIDIQTYSPPKAAMATPALVEGNTYKFINQSSNASVITWRIGAEKISKISGGSNDTLLYTFASIGNYTIAMYAMGKSGDVDSVTYGPINIQKNTPSIIAGAVSKTWKLKPIEKAMVVGPVPGMGNPPDYTGNWYASNADRITQVACDFAVTYTFNNDGSPTQSTSMVRDVNGSINNPDGGACTVTSTLTGETTVFGNGTFTYRLNNLVTPNTLTLTGKGVWMGLPKVQETGEVANFLNPISSITFEVYSLSETEMILKKTYKDVSSWYFTFQAQ